MRMSSAAPALAMPPSVNAIAKACCSRFIPASRCCLVRSRSGDGAAAEIAAGLGEFGLQALHQFSDRRRVVDLADALARAPDVAPRLRLRVAAGAEIHLGLVGDR